MEDRTLSVIIPNYRTPLLTTLCMRLLAKNSDLSKIKVIVVDNDSNDDSLNYLRELDWITLVERHNITGENGPEMHVKALDFGVREVDTPFFMIMHTDTLMLAPDWYDYLMEQITSDDDIGGVGSWKLEQMSKLKVLGKKLENIVRCLLGKKTKDRRHFLRSHCALYRTDVFRKYTGGFADAPRRGMTAGENIHLDMERNGYRMVFLPSEDLGKRIRHFNHATMILNPQPEARRTSDSKCKAKLLKEIDAEGFRKILEDDSLDHPTVNHP
ncbi:MAG: glycosyltransferase [Victivallaceae bacterium]|nr:glycosyltransferase [Victivallaceae bacterium]